jgi:ferredoxin/flavodoxin---NADP+ reductase
MIEQLSSTEQDICNATIIDRQDLTAELTVVRIRPDSGAVPDFEPGQFIKLGLPRPETESPVVQPGREGPRLIRRAYSIASAPRQRDYIELLIVRVDYGKLTPKLWTLDEGGRVWMDGKTAGRFTLEPIPRDKDVVMVATGTGIAPFISMLRTHADEPRWRRAVIINGVRYAADLGYRQELETFSRDNPRITYLPIASREPEAESSRVITTKDDATFPPSPVTTSAPVVSPSWTGLRGRVQQVLEPRTYESLADAVLAPSECHVMLCGNPEMIISVQRMLEDQGFHVHSPTQPGNIHFERYW